MLELSGIGGRAGELCVGVHEQHAQSGERGQRDDKHRAEALGIVVQEARSGRRGRRRGGGRGGLILLLCATSLLLTLGRRGGVRR